MFEILTLDDFGTDNFFLKSNLKGWFDKKKCNCISNTTKRI